jgi:large subunit ribosomal protein L15
MMHKTKKSKKYRGSKTHGCGSMKKRRGKGNKGGAGNAGSGKRADQKKPSFWGLKTGRLGFISKTSNQVNAINTAQVKILIENKTLKEEKGMYDLTKLGYTKLLGKGNTNLKVKIKIRTASKKVVENIKKQGGEVILSSKEEKQE